MAEEAGGGRMPQPIIIKKVKGGGHGHHGGAWKIAYADFVTAMMAFFLLLWLLNSVTQEQLEGISDYFAPVSVSEQRSGSGDVLGGKVLSEEGAATSTTSRDSVTVDLPPPKAGTGGQESAETVDVDGKTPDEQAAEEVLKQREQENFEEAKQELEETLDSMPQMRRLKESLLIDNTPEGLRIQLVDNDGLSLFPSGSSEMYLHTKRLLEVVATIILKLPQDVSISGHTDATRFGGGGDYGNWELSADRANAARRWLEPLKIPEERISRVVGKAATEPLLPEDPKNARNRRLSIVMLRGTGADNPARDAAAAEDEALPGLGDIKRRQLNEGGPGVAPDPARPSDNETLPGLQLDLTVDPTVRQ